MGELCEAAIDEGDHRPCKEGSIEQAKEVIAGLMRRSIRCEKDIERLCLKLLLQQQPVARDLRQDLGGP